MEAPIRAILLDFDGTLVDSEPLHYESWSHAVRPHGAQVTWEDYQQRFVGITDRQAGEILLSEAGKSPTAELLDQVCVAKHSFYRSRSSVELAVDAEVCGILGQIARNLPIAIVSSSVTAEVEPVLTKAGLRPLLQVVVCGDHVSRHKPDPEPYLLALRLVGANPSPISAGECMVFEDSRAGVAAATAAGMRVQRVTSPADLTPALQKILRTLPQ